MRKPDLTSLAATKASAADDRGDATVEVVCLALALALLALGLRIASIW